MEKSYDKSLLYRRQFLITSKEVESPSLCSWNRLFLGNSFFIYTHKDLSLTQVKSKNYYLTLAGFMIDSNNQLNSDSEILSSLLVDFESGKDIFASLAPIGGRWVLIVNKNEDIFLLNDAMGFRQVYYYIDSIQNVWCASQPNLISEVSCLVPDEVLMNNFFKSYIKSNCEYWFPGELTEFRGLKKLLPNHYLDLITGIPKRFWPMKKIAEIEKSVVLNQTINILKNSIHNAMKRFKLSLPLTCGLDSRILLSFCKDIKQDVFIYTLLYPPNTSKSSDITVPTRMSKSLGFSHNLIHASKIADKDFLNLCERNVKYLHSYWANITFSLLNVYPDDRVCLKGNGLEVARCYYHKDGYYSDNNVTVEYLTNLEWGDNQIAQSILEKWLNEAKYLESEFNVNVLDLFYWEHRMGNWQAMSQLEWDIAQEAFSPFNNRLLMEQLLSVNKKYRIWPDYIFYAELINFMWPELLSFPINPSFKSNLKILLKKLRIYYLIKFCLNKLKRVKC